eukprot:TRINITY_DN1052_c0_g1_i4.p2 TRINITY_DN1052_c0_g1~~TRINITY_DN1052_c0_g1_i4.p2  ORF type:complete len:122 (+),score=53.06 TRINITY_DN1052_c0_g1_i4:107-472(+)
MLLRRAAARGAFAALPGRAQRWQSAHAGADGKKKPKVSRSKAICQLFFFGSMCLMGVYVMVLLPLGGALRWMGLRAPAAAAQALTDEEKAAIQEDLREVRRDVKILTAHVNNLSKKFLQSA